MSGVPAVRSRRSSVAYVVERRRGAVAAASDRRRQRAVAIYWKRASVSGLLRYLTAREYVHELTPTVGGTAPTRPVYTVLYAPGTDFAIERLWIENVTLEQSLIVARTFSPGETVVVDCDAFSVEVDGVAVDFEGQFPLLDPRPATTNQVLLHVHAGSAPSLTFSAAWQPRYLS